MAPDEGTDPPSEEDALDALLKKAELLPCVTGGGPGGPAYGTGKTPPRDFAPKPGQRVVKIVIMGDSYMSGEGAGDYYSKTGKLPPKPVQISPTQWAPATGYTREDYATDFRHRSANAPALLAIEHLKKLNPGVAFDVRFNASSGARTEHFYTAQSDNNRENPPQREGLDGDTDLVITGLGANDAGFGPLIMESLWDDDRAFDAVADNHLPLLNSRDAATEWQDATTSSGPGATMTARYIRLVRDIHQSTFNQSTGKSARVMMVSYPQGLSSEQTALLGIPMLLSAHERAHLISLAPKLAASMARAQQTLVNHGVQLDLLDLQDVFKGHEIGTPEAYVNNLVSSPAELGAESYNAFNLIQQTAHPTRMGAQLLATYYARMIATEVGLWVPPAGELPQDGPTEPCQPGLQKVPSVSTPTPAPGTGSATGGGSTGGSGGGGGGDGGPLPEPGLPPDNGGSAGGVMPPPPSGPDGGGQQDPGSPPSYGDIDSVTPVPPTEPVIPDDLAGGTPTIPITPVAPNNGGDEPKHKTMLIQGSVTIKGNRG